MNLKMCWKRVFGIIGHVRSITRRDIAAQQELQDNISLHRTESSKAIASARHLERQANTAIGTMRVVNRQMGFLQAELEFIRKLRGE